jgi:hypothetical protein
MARIDEHAVDLAAEGGLGKAGTDRSRNLTDWSGSVMAIIGESPGGK